MKKLQARLLRGHHRRRRALPPGPARGRHGRRLHRPQARPQEGRPTRTRRSSRSSRTPTASSSTRSRSCRSPRRWPATRSAAPICCAAPWARRRRRRWRRRRPSSSTAPRRRASTRKVADDIFDLMAKFAGYGFNKSHSAAYGLVTYQTAYLKHYYPDEFMAGTAHLRQGRHRQGRQEHRRGARASGIEVLPPDVNESLHDFSVRASTKARRRRSSASACRRSRASARARSRRSSRRARQAGEAASRTCSTSASASTASASTRRCSRR